MFPTTYPEPEVFKAVTVIVRSFVVATPPSSAPEIVNVSPSS